MKNEVLPEYLLGSSLQPLRVKQHNTNVKDFANVNSSRYTSLLLKLLKYTNSNLNFNYGKLVNHAYFIVKYRTTDVKKQNTPITNQSILWNGSK